MNTGLQEFHAPRSVEIDGAHPGVSIQSDNQHLPGQIRVVAADNTPLSTRAPSTPSQRHRSTELQDGKYLYSPATGRIEVHWIQGIAAPTPRAAGQAHATVINGILSRNSPGAGAARGFARHRRRAAGHPLSYLRRGAYLPIGTTLPIFAGGVIRWLVDQAVRKAGEAAEPEGDISPAPLRQRPYRGGRIVGLIGVASRHRSHLLRQPRPAQLPA